MTTEMGVILWTAALFLAIIISFAVKPKYVGKFLGIVACITAIGGILMYGYGYAYTEQGNPPLAVLKAAFAVIGMFVGKNAFDDISAAPAFQYAAMQLICWLLHVFGLSTSIGAAAVKLGAGLMRRIRLLLSFRGDLALIYGVDEETVAFARQLLGKKTSVVFIDRTADSVWSQNISNMGCVLCTDGDALGANRRFAKSIGLRAGNRKVALYALTGDTVENQQYAKKLLQTMKELEIPAQQTSLTIISQEGTVEASFQATGEQYGYGTVIGVNAHELAARVMIRQYPPCDTMEFDETGRAKGDFHALVVGFGSMGQAVLRHLVMNGQFVGSRFQATVFAPGCDEVAGHLAYTCKDMLEQYEITFCSHDGRSRQMFDYLTSAARKLRYVVICTGNEKHNQEVEQQLRSFLSERGCHPVILRCNRHEVTRRTEAGAIEHHPIFTRELLCSQLIDRTAMILNQSYCQGTTKTAEENWQSCDYFSRMSSRASADFAPALLRVAGMQAKDLLDGPWRPEGILLENLARTEHLRWNAFHFAMGFEPMPREVYEQRAAAYREEKARTGDSKFRIGKDMQAKQHACLIPWEALDQLSARENEITGDSVDYQQMDRNNVYALADVLRAAQEV